MYTSEHRSETLQWQMFSVTFITGELVKAEHHGELQHLEVQKLRQDLSTVRKELVLTSKCNLAINLYFPSISETWEEHMC